MAEAGSERNRKRSPAGRLIFSCLTSVAVCAIVAVVIWTRHNAIDPIAMPDRQMPAENARDDFMRAARLAMAVKHKSPDDSPYPDTLWNFPGFQGCAGDAEPVLAALHDGFKKTFMAPTPAQRGPSDLSSMREMGRDLEGASDYYVIVGQPMRSAEVKLDLWQASVMSARGGDMMDALVGIAIEHMALRGFEELLPKLTAPELARVAARVDAVAALRTPYADTLTETAYADAKQILDYLRSPQGTSFAAARANAGGFGLDLGAAFGNKSSLSEQAKVDWKALDIYFADKSAAIRENLDYTLALAAEARKPYAGHSQVKPPHNIYSDSLDYLYSGRKKQLTMEAATALLQVEVALLRYRKEFGRYPSALQELTPRLLKAIPDDPYGGAAGVPLHYKPNDDGRSFLLYSLGPAMKDLGGATGKYLLQSEDGNIVAGRLYHPLKLPQAPSAYRADLALTRPTRGFVPGIRARGKVTVRHD
jgi:hypothetical protein